MGLTVATGLRASTARPTQLDCAHAIYVAGAPARLKCSRPSIIRIERILRFRRCHELKSEDDCTICLSDRDTSRRKLSPHLKVQIAFERSGGFQVLEAPHLELESKRGEACFDELHFCRRIGKNVGVMGGGSE